MLEENKALRMRLHSLTIFRGLLEDPVVSRLAALLHAQPSDAEACADAYCAFAAALYERGGDLSTYLLKAVLEDENLYVRRAASGAPIPAELAECLQHELCFLQELSQFDGASLRGALKGAFLPRWGTQTLDFAARYEENIRTLPLHGYGIYAKYHVFTVHSGAIVPVRHPDCTAALPIAESQSILQRCRLLLLPFFPPTAPLLFHSWCPPCLFHLISSISSIQ